eukprot:TRINITY_DN1535_c0_g1_i1.p1 TRINITY_DN1535_c0_g1~~TRINITY_DN1535_c0_g1_i1.p1  ORF type:complete len:330 (-),score=22.91 TRINITY_DN1535_c0_g1_i1:316-1305(-)
MVFVRLGCSVGVSRATFIRRSRPLFGVQPILPRSDHPSHKDTRAPTDETYLSIWPPYRRFLDVQHYPDPESFVKPSISVQKAPKSRIHDWGPTVADTRVHMVVMDDDGVQYLMQGTANGRQSIFEMMLESQIPFTRRSPNCEPAGAWGEANCYQCHIVFPKKIYDKTPAPIFKEYQILFELELMGLYHPTSRLACQLPVTKMYDGIVTMKPHRAPWFNWQAELYKPTNRARGMRGQDVSISFARSQRVTPMSELNTDGENAEIHDLNSAPTFADTFWARRPDEFFNAKRQGRFFPGLPDKKKFRFTEGAHPYGGVRPFRDHWEPPYFFM